MAKSKAPTGPIQLSKPIDKMDRDELLQALHQAGKNPSPVRPTLRLKKDLRWLVSQGQVIA